MNPESRNRLQEIQDALGALDGPEAIERADGLGGYAREIGRCAEELTGGGEPEPGEAAERLARAAKAVLRAEKAAGNYRINPLTSGFSQGRFAMAVNQARGWLGGALDALDGVEDPSA
ncbi:MULTISPECIES: hypothetical protein [unclassified Streptomyces]|uniref:hypothetical protein n=1 Tax=unclassified Streptomyces TaxID=2593676 RepID=UPI00382111FF